MKWAVFSSEMLLPHDSLCRISYSFIPVALINFLEEEGLILAHGLRGYSPSHRDSMVANVSMATEMYGWHSSHLGGKGSRNWIGRWAKLWTRSAWSGHVLIKIPLPTGWIASQIGHQMGNKCSDVTFISWNLIRQNTFSPISRLPIFLIVSTLF